MSRERILEENSISSSRVQDRYLWRDSLQPCRMKVGVIKCVQRSVQTVASSEFIEDDVKKLFGCFIMCGYPIKNASLEVKAARDKDEHDGVDTAIKLENLFLCYTLKIMFEPINRMNKHSIIVCVLCIYKSRTQDSTVVFQECLVIIRDMTVLQESFGIR